uniref:WW domain binding protein 1-like n=1 Tax=Styela clava TaxID=7725 RepID=UPI0019398502|nr:WW domain binding protein 1-like [Styela clava]XP_039274064.1 WW domain binding protein 1-like [Styela clava]
MDVTYGVILFLLSCLALLDGSQATCTSYNCDGYCCGYNTCCYVYLTWWFWLIILGLFLLKVCCITCYVRRRRQRANMYYVPTVAQPSTTVHVNARVSMPPRTAPHAPGTCPPHYTGQQQQMPPPYPGPQASAPPATGPGYAGPMYNGSQDSQVNKDTQMLIG